MQAASKAESFMLGDWRVEPTLCRIARGKDVVRLDPQHMKLLQLLTSRPGEVFSQAEIEATVWGSAVVTSNSVYQGIAQLRRALGDSKTKPLYIETIPRKGYRLIAGVRDLPSADEFVQPAAPIDPDLPKRHWRFPVGAALAVACLMLLTSVYVLYEQHSGSAGAFTGLTPEDGYEQLLLATQQREGEISTDYAVLLMQLAHQENLQGRDAESRKHLKAAVAIQRQVSREHPQLALMLSRLALAYTWNTDLEQAEAAAREAVEILDQHAPQLHSYRQFADYALGTVLLEKQDYSGAEHHLQRSLSLAARISTPLDIWTIDAQISLADLRVAQGRFKEAEQLSRQAIAGHARSRGVHGREAANYRGTLALALIRMGRHTEAMVQLQTIIAEAGDNHPLSLSSRHFIGECQLELGHLAEAEATLRSVLDALKRSNSEPWRIARTKSALGATLLAQHRTEEAAVFLETALRDLQGPGNWSQRQALEEAQQRLRQLEARRLHPTEDLASVRDFADDEA